MRIKNGVIAPLPPPSFFSVMSYTLCKHEGSITYTAIENKAKRGGTKVVAAVGAGKKSTL